MCGKCAVHGSDTSSQADTDNDPGICRHESIAPAAAMECLRRDANHADTQAGVEKCFVEVRALEGWHASIFTGLAVEDEICGHESAPYECGAVEEALTKVGSIWRGDRASGLLIGAAEALLENMAVCETGKRGGLREGGSFDGGGGVESSCGGRGGFGKLFDCRGQGEWSAEHECHG